MRATSWYVSFTGSYTLALNGPCGSLRVPSNSGHSTDIGGIISKVNWDKCSQQPRGERSQINVQWHVAKSWAWLHHSNFQLIALELPWLQTCKAKSGSFICTLKRSEAAGSWTKWEDETKERGGITEMKDRNSGSLEKTISGSISTA